MGGPRGVTPAPPAPWFSTGPRLLGRRCVAACPGPRILPLSDLGGGDAGQPPSRRSDGFRAGEVMASPGESRGFPCLSSRVAGQPRAVGGGVGLIPPRELFLPGPECAGAGASAGWGSPEQASIQGTETALPGEARPWGKQRGNPRGLKHWFEACFPHTLISVEWPPPWEAGLAPSAGHVPRGGPGDRSEEPRPAPHGAGIRHVALLPPSPPPIATL